jgi:hypothetical protein
MKKIFTAIVICLFMVSMSGCKKNERMYFDTTHPALNIWFGTTAGTVLEQTTFNFAYQNDMDSVIFNARLSGEVVDYDRTFTLEAVDGDISKVDYVFGDYMIPAGEYLVQFPIYFRKPANFNEFKDEEGSIVFKMKANSEFFEGAQGQNSITVTLKNAVGKPDNWDAEVSSYYRTLTYYFGTYSDVKYAFIINVTGMSNFRIYYSTSLPAGTPDNVIPSSQAQYMNRQCRTALAKYNETNTVPLTDEFGNLVEFPNR